MQLNYYSLTPLFISWLLFSMAHAALEPSRQTPGAAVHNTPAMATRVENLLLSDDLEIDVSVYPAQGNHILLWLAPGYGYRSTHVKMAGALNALGIEVWYADILQALFIEPNPDAMRQLTGRYVADLIDHAHTLTGKRIVLVGSWYMAIPALRGARQWQLKKPEKEILSGAILFSPSLYRGVPALGQEVSYLPIVSATNIPLVIMQAGDNNNRWYLDSLLQTLQIAGSSVYTDILSGVRDLFYFQEHLPREASTFEALPDRMRKMLHLLDRTATPLKAAALHEVPTSDADDLGFDHGLRSYTGVVTPRSIHLPDIDGKLYSLDAYLNRTTVLNFWTTWCPPCIEEIPSLNRLRQAMDGEPFELVSVNYAESSRIIRKFLDKIDVDFPVLIDADGRESARWKVFTLPSTFVIGPDGVIHYGVNAAIEWDAPEVIHSLKALGDSAKPGFVKRAEKQGG